MTRLAYFDLAHGISGDMTLACLAHAGRRMQVDVESAVSEAVASLGMDCSVAFIDEERSSIACIRADVRTDAASYDADQLRAAIERADVSGRAATTALRGLDLLVGAEAAVHGTDASDVHLHELGSADTAADLVGAAVGLDALGIDVVAAAPIPVTRGWFSTAHGRLPAPAPVTLEVLAGARLRGVDEEGELVTPTGAAILVAHGAVFGPAPEIELTAIGTGAGTRIGDVPNICRVLVGEADANGGGAVASTVVVLETNIDDQTPQGLAHAMDRLLDAGALDAWITPVVMKKSRAAFQLSVLSRSADEGRVLETMFKETTTLGVRRRTTTRWALEREEICVRVLGRVLRVKVARLDGSIVNVAPEYDDCVATASVTDESFEAIRVMATKAARAALDWPADPR